MNIPIVTVFTPTYNRGYILPALYKSLKQQTCSLFEWIVVDDGSTDNTEEIVLQWKQEEDIFSIIYVKTNNGGKHRAINRGTQLAKGKLFFIVDSDDYLADNAIERLIYWENTITDKSAFAGVCCNRICFDGTLMGKTFSGQSIDCYYHKRKKYGIEGDKAEAYYTSLLRQYPFPTFENETFLNEGVVWNRISKAGYALRYFNEGLYFAEYREDGLTHHIREKMRENIQGTLLALKESFFLQERLIDRARVGSLYFYYGRKNRLNFSNFRQNLQLTLTMFCFLFLAFIWRVLHRK